MSGSYTIIVCVCVCVCVCVHSLTCVKLLATPWSIAHQAPLSMKFPGKNTGVGCHFLLQGLFLTQGVSCLGRQILYYWTTWEAPNTIITSWSRGCLCVWCYDKKLLFTKYHGKQRGSEDPGIKN